MKTCFGKEHPWPGYIAHSVKNSGPPDYLLALDGATGVADATSRETIAKQKHSLIH